MARTRIMYPSDKMDSFNVRMSEGLRDRIKAFAAANNRSMNSEILKTLDLAYPAPPIPESLNEALFEASEAVASAWASVLATVGQNPEDNQQLSALLARLDDARKAGA